jgi:uncharacterized protein YkwD
MMYRLLLLVVLFAASFAAPAQAAGSRVFPETGHRIEGRFLQYWEQNGGLAQFGYPISAVVSETGEDGVARQVQYFERNRFELHPEKPRPYDVLLGRLGVVSLTARGIDWRTLPRGVAGADCSFFPETQRSLCEPFRSHWQRQGGLAIFGLPISDAFTEQSPTDGKAYLVQYFERNRFEYHPENPRPFHVQLGLLGTETFGARRVVAQPTLDPILQRLVDLTNAVRRDHGLAQLAVSPALSQVAAEYSQVQAAQGRLSHTGPDGSRAGDRVSRGGYRWSFVAENLAAGQADADAVFASWMNSDGHRANMLNANAREIGIGRTFVAQDPARFANYWVMLLAAPR